jgi:serine/threonine protein kinase
MKKIGSGSYGSVYYDRKKSEAIKKCFHEDTGNIWSGNIREMDILRRCGDHPNIVKLKKVCIAEKHEAKHNKLSLHLQFYDMNLQSYISSFSNGRVDISIIRSIMVQVLLGLEYLHANHIIHRDLKPDNILINPDTMEVALCDFGMSDIIMKYRKSEIKVTAPLYRAPEVFKEHKYSAEVDLWAMGLILFTMIQGDCPFKYPTEKEEEIKAKIRSLDPDKYDHEISILKGELKKVMSDEIRDIEKENKIKDRILNLELAKDQETSMIAALNVELKKIILDEIRKIDVRKTFSAKYLFTKLLNGLLREDPSKRFTASQALEDSFFDPVRASIIIPTRSKFPPVSMRLRKLYIEDIPERKWMTKYTMKYVADHADLTSDNLYSVVFHGLDIFEKLLRFYRMKEAYAENSKGKYMHENEAYLYLYTCFYIAHKYYAVTEIAFDFEDFFPEDLLKDDNMQKAEEFEAFLLTHVLDYVFFEYTLYEIAEEMINHPDAAEYYKILKGYLTVTQKTANYNSYRSLYRDQFVKTKSSETIED